MRVVVKITDVWGNHRILVHLNHDEACRLTALQGTEGIGAFLGAAIPAFLWPALPLLASATLNKMPDIQTATHNSGGKGIRLRFDSPSYFPAGVKAKGQGVSPPCVEPETHLRPVEGEEAGARVTLTEEQLQQIARILAAGVRPMQPADEDDEEDS